MLCRRHKKGYINFVPKLVRRPSVSACMSAYVRTAVMFLVNASPHKPLYVATATLQVHRSHDIKVLCEGQIMYFSCKCISSLTVGCITLNLQGA